MMIPPRAPPLAMYGSTVLASSTKSAFGKRRRWPDEQDGIFDIERVIKHSILLLLNRGTCKLYGFDPGPDAWREGGLAAVCCQRSAGAPATVRGAEGAPAPVVLISEDIPHQRQR